MTAAEPHDQPHGHRGHEHGHGDGHGSVHLGEEEWAAYAVDTELRGEVFIGFLTDSITRVDEWRGAAAPVMQRIFDVGSGPGVAACALAGAYPEATVTAIDSSTAMLARAAARAARLGLTDRVDTHLAELPGGLDDLDDLGKADLIWASMSLHHIGDEVGALRVLRDLLSPSGLIVIAEVADPTRVLPDEFDIARPGLADRLDAVGAAWFADMRSGLSDSVESGDLSSMLVAAGFEVLDERIVRLRVDSPLSDDARRVASGELRRMRAQFGERLDADDRHALDILCDPNDESGAVHRGDLFLSASCQIVIARPARS